MSDLITFVSSGIAVGLLYGLVAMGLVLVFKSSGVFNVAQGSLVMFGAYFAYTFANKLGWPFWLSAALAIPLCFLLGVVLERVFLRPMIGQPVLSTIMITITLWIILEGVALMAWNPMVWAFKGVKTSGVVGWGAARIGLPYAYGIVAAIISFVIFWLFYRRSGLGLAMRATADDETAAHSMGVSAKRIYSMTWGIAAMVAGVAGISMGMIAGVSPGLIGLGFKAFAVVILGGMESVGGALLAGVIVGVAENLAAAYIDPYVGGGMKEVFPFILMMLILILKPYGLFGLKRIERI